MPCGHLTDGSCWITVSSVTYSHVLPGMGSGTVDAMEEALLGGALTLLLPHCCQSPRSGLRRLSFFYLFAGL
jgi:hypothetical protein